MVWFPELEWCSFVTKSKEMHFWVQNYLFCNDDLVKTHAGKCLV